MKEERRMREIIKDILGGGVVGVEQFITMMMLQVESAEGV